MTVVIINRLISNFDRRMKNEDKIIELLVTLLQRTDQHSDLLEKHSEILEKHSTMFEGIPSKVGRANRT